MLHFEVQRKQHIRADHEGSVKKPLQYPCFLLVFNYNWNDKDYYTWFALRYYPAEDADSILIGELKLMCTDSKNTFECLSKAFDGHLDAQKFCSLGIDYSYYRNIHDILHPLGLDVDLLQALCDCTHDVRIYDRFKDTECFKDSLIRDLRSEKALHDARFLLSGTKRSEAYSFVYKYIPKYDNTVSATWKLHLEYDSPDYLRTVGIIGINGVGKTQMLSQFVDDFLTNNTPNFDHTPLFSSCIVVCSTRFDQYNNQQRAHNRKPFANCCLEHISVESTRNMLKRCFRTMNEGGRMLGEKTLVQRYTEMVEAYLGHLADGLFSVVQDDSNKYEMDDKCLKSLIGILSSGQLHILKLISCVCANIMMSSLLIIDEPEIHLHPQFILEFMTMLGEMLIEFDSFAIIATHSPLVVREIVNSQVFLMKRMEGGIPQIGPVTFDTFGEDAALLYRNIFGYCEEESYFTRIVSRMVANDGYASTVQELEKHMRLSMNARLAIRDIACHVNEKGGSV